LQLLLTQQELGQAQAPPLLLVLLLVLAQVPAPQLQGRKKASCVRHTNA
jgi:hypothetical protein